MDRELAGSVGISNAYFKDANKFLKSSNNTELSFVDKITPSDPRKASLLYDASLGYIDSEIKRILDFLKKNEMFNNTLIVIFSDHGTQVGEESRKDLTCSFYDEYVRVPLIFYSPKLLPKSIKANVGLIDMAPTVLDLLGLAPSPHFKGMPVYANVVTERPYIMLENAGRGPCDISRKALNVSFRSSDWKFIYSEVPDSNKEIGFDVELYDLNLDKTENNDLSKEDKHAALVATFVAIAQARCEEVRSNI